jgi:hypothetical protein
MSAASLAIVAPLQPNARPSQKPVPIDDEYAVRIVEHKRGSHHPMRHCAQYYAQEIRYRTLRRLPRPSTNQSCGRPREAAYPRKASTCPLGSCSRESNPPTTILPTSRTPTVARFGGRPTAATAAACYHGRRGDPTGSLRNDEAPLHRFSNGHPHRVLPEPPRWNLEAQPDTVTP